MGFDEVCIELLRGIAELRRLSFGSKRSRR